MMPMSDSELRVEYERLERERRAKPAPARRSITDVLDQLDAHDGIRLESDGAGLARCSELTTEALEAFFANRTSALCVPGFADPTTCELLARFIKTSKIRGWAATDTSYGAGMPVNALSWSLDTALAYFREAAPAMRRMREAAGGRLTPIDKLRLELDELWPAGAHVSVDNPYRRKMFVGLARIMKPEGMLDGVTRDKGIVHADSSPLINAERGCFSANVYLEVPEQGGELTVFPLAMKQPDHLQSLVRVVAFLLDHSFDETHRDRVQQKLHAILPEPVTIKPEAGDLIMLNTGRPHAVRGFGEGTRVTVQAFVNHRAGKALELFS